VAWLSENTAHCLGVPFDSYSMFNPIRSLQIFIFLSNMTLRANLFSGAKHRCSFTVAPMICDQARKQQQISQRLHVTSYNNPSWESKALFLAPFFLFLS